MEIKKFYEEPPEPNGIVSWHVNKYSQCVYRLPVGLREQLRYLNRLDRELTYYYKGNNPLFEDGNSGAKILSYLISALLNDT